MLFIIPFLKEGKEIYETLSSIRSTAGFDADILLVNDCSNDLSDYKKWGQLFKATYIENDHRMGVAESRNIGVRFPFNNKYSSFNLI